MKRHNKRGYFSPATIMALLLAALALGLPFIMNGPVNDEDILTPLPTPESTVTTITEDSKITAVPTQKPVAVTTKKRTDVSPKPSVATSKAATPSAPAAVVSGETVKSVQDKAVNTKGVQLIFTTHDAMLLDLNFFRRDQIWFAEKNDETCATEFYSLASFSPRKGENVRKGYLQGRFGAIPFIGGDA